MADAGGQGTCKCCLHLQQTIGNPQALLGSWMQCPIKPHRVTWGWPRSATDHTVQNSLFVLKKKTTRTKDYKFFLTFSFTSWKKKKKRKEKKQCLEGFIHLHTHTLSHTKRPPSPHKKRMNTHNICKSFLLLLVKNQKCLKQVKVKGFIQLLGVLDQKKVLFPCPARYPPPPPPHTPNPLSWAQPQCH